MLKDQLLFQDFVLLLPVSSLCLLPPVVKIFSLMREKKKKRKTVIKNEDADDKDG